MCEDRRDNESPEVVRQGACAEEVMMTWVMGRRGRGRHVRERERETSEPVGTQEGRDPSGEVETHRGLQRASSSSIHWHWIVAFIGMHIAHSWWVVVAILLCGGRDGRGAWAGGTHHLCRCSRRCVGSRVKRPMSHRQRRQRRATRGPPQGSRRQPRERGSRGKERREDSARWSGQGSGRERERASAVRRTTEQHRNRITRAENVECRRCSE